MKNKLLDILNIKSPYIPDIVLKILKVLYAYLVKIYTTSKA